jgi:hypothetical protein
MILSKAEYTQIDLRKVFHVVLYSNSVSIVRLYAKFKNRSN